jgi:dipeptidyl-peptidase-4
MKKSASWAAASLAAALLLASATQTLAQAPAAAVAAPNLTLEQLFRAQPYRGEPAKDAAFSRSGRYLAYLWNPFGEPGTDLHVHDTRSGKTLRLSSRALMAAIDTPEELARFDKKRQQRDAEWAERQAREEAQAAYLRGAAVDLNQWERAAIEIVKQEAADKKARDDAQKAADKLEAEAEKQAMAELEARRAGKPLPPAPAASAASAPAATPLKKEDWEWRDELKKKQAKHKLKPTDLYPGVGAFVWAHERDELVFQYRGHLLRWQAGQDRALPLLATQRTLRPLAYTRDDQGFIYLDEGRVLRARFGSLNVQVLNRELVHPDDAEKKYKIEATTLSEDGRWMALTARAPLGEEGKPPPKPGRQVEIMNYGERFATAKKVDREVSDDKRLVLPTALYIRAVPQGEAAPGKQPEPVFTHKGGDVWFEMSPVAWSRDGSRYTFATWEREKELLRIYLGRADENAKPEVVIERRGDVGHEVVNVLRPRFTPDGKTLVAVLDEAGWRQPYGFDIANRTLKPLVQGEFEAHQVLGFTPDSQAMFVLANRDDLAAMNVYRVNLQNGAMLALGAAPDYHRNAAVAHDGQAAAAVAGHWGARPELKLLKAGAPARALTDSHDPAWAQVDALRPERFSFKNRHGDTLHAYAFKPAGWQASDRRPAVVYVYGGPLNDRHTVETDSFQPTGYQFGMYMAAKHGYVTVTLDTRGHSNYGRRFSDANWEHAGAPQAEDLEDLHRHLVANFGVDGARVGLNGWSFGGFQTQYTLFTRPDLFAAGIAGAGPTEWENYNSWYSGRTIGKVDRSKPNLRKYSLLPLAKNLKKPLLLVHGMQDPNVLYQDTVNVYRALLESGKEALVDLFLDPDGEHGLGGAVKSVGWHRKYEAFWLRHLGPAR